jgi:hypothetical protein
MIQYRPVRGLAFLLVVLGSATPVGAAATGGLVAIWWQPPGDPPPAAPTRAAFVDAARRRGAAVVDAREPARAESSLVPLLEAAVADYAAFRFAVVLAKLDELARVADARGGGDLDQRQLAEIYLYRGLARLEVGPAEAAWDDLVRAARLDPTRAIDPARFAPRVVSAYRRAIAEVAQLPRAELEVAAPPGASVRVDGRTVVGATAVPVGAHFVAVAAEGYEPWSAVVVVSGANERLQPPLRRYQPPDADRLAALGRERGAGRALLGALVRGDEGWRFVARELTLADGKTVSGGVALGETPVTAAVENVVARLTPAEVALVPAATPAPRSRWWIWAVAGGVAATLAVVIPVSVVYGGASSNGTIGGSVGLR